MSGKLVGRGSIHLDHLLRKGLKSMGNFTKFKQQKIKVFAFNAKKHLNPHFKALLLFPSDCPACLIHYPSSFLLHP
jgi:hypothetical protein